MVNVSQTIYVTNGHMINTRVNSHQCL